MRFHTFGSDSNKAIVLIHGMLNPWQLWQQAIDAFAPAAAAAAARIEN